MHKKQNLGFTLIELLVVISIIGMLSSIVFAVTKKTVVRSRDSRRAADVDALNQALHLYYASNGNVPPCTTPGYTGGCDYLSPDGGQLDSTADGVFLPFASNYLRSTAIKDPLNKNGYFYYFGSGPALPLSSGITYDFLIGAIMEEPNSELTASNPPPYSGSTNVYIRGQYRPSP